MAHGFFATEDGKKAGLELVYPKNMTVCKMNGQTLFEIFHESGDSFRTAAELYTPSGSFIKCHDAPMPEVIKSNGEALQIGGMIMSHNMFSGCRIGVWLKSDGSYAIGCS